MLERIRRPVQRGRARYRYPLLLLYQHLLHVLDILYQ